MKYRGKFRFSPRVSKRVLLGALTVISAFVLVNAALWVLYRDRTYPGTTVMGTKIGSVAYRDLSDKISNANLFAPKLTFRLDKQSSEVSLQELGVRKEVHRTTRSADQQRAWLPLVNLFRSPKLQAPVAIDNTRLHTQADVLAERFHKDAANARLQIQNGQVNILPSQKGYTLRRTALQESILQSLDADRHIVPVVTDSIEPETQAKTLAPKQNELRRQLATALTYTYSGKTIQPSTTDIGAWYVPDGDSLGVSLDKIQTYLTHIGTQWGIRIKNSKQVAETTRQDLAKQQAQTITIERQIALKTFTYCTAVKGVDAGQLTALKPMLQSTYANARGWSLDGLVEFKEVASGCNFTVWLSAAPLMPSFGAICDAMWSCRSGSNVVINFDRWQQASPSWNANGGTLTDYRHMVINHETGHWLGFGHSSCPGSAQPAPVMQQQSIDLQGCTFNPWPTPSELATFRQGQGI